jgi:hypothetical protein
MTKVNNKPFSQELEDWLKTDKPKTLGDLTDHFAEKSFAILFLILMAIPALPLPTGGVTHLFELIVMLLCLEMIASRRQVWLPKKWRRLKIAGKFLSSTLPALIRLTRRIERYTRPRLKGVLQNFVASQVIGLVVLGLTAFAFIAPPFTGLDTLPALGVVLISLSIILEDFLLFIAGVLVGSVGISLILAAGKLVLSLF